MKRLIGFLIVIGSWIGALYVGGYLMFINPIIEASKAFDAGTLTGYIIGITIIKCIFASAVFSIIAYIGTFIGAAIISD